MDGDIHLLLPKDRMCFPGVEVQMDSSDMENLLTGIAFVIRPMFSNYLSFMKLSRALCFAYNVVSQSLVLTCLLFFCFVFPEK